MSEIQSDCKIEFQNECRLCSGTKLIKQQRIINQAIMQSITTNCPNCTERIIGKISDVDGLEIKHDCPLKNQYNDYIFCTCSLLNIVKVGAREVVECHINNCFFAARWKVGLAGLGYCSIHVDEILN